MSLIEGSRSNPYTTHDYAGIVANNPIKTIKLAEDVTSYDKAVLAYDRILWAIHQGKLGSHRRRRVASATSWQDVMIASNVWLRRVLSEAPGIEPYMAIVLYDTEIVRYYPDGTFSVDNGGFNTPTTSSRITQFTPDGFHAWHKDKQIILTNIDSDWNARTFHPATHNERITL
jgi:hypothetical protein